MDFILQFSSWAEFFAMGKHGLYVWSSYGLSLVLLFLCLLVPWLKLKRTRKHLKRLIAREQAVKAAAS